MKESRKIAMMNKSYFGLAAIGLPYFATMVHLGTPPDPLVVTALIASIGSIGTTGNIANGLEHKHAGQA